MSKFTVKPGSKVTIGIRGDAEESVAKTGSRYIGVETQGDDYVFRKQGTTLHFFEIDPDAGIYNFPDADLTPFPNRHIKLEKAQELDAANVAALASNSVVELNAREGEWVTQSYAFDAQPGPGWTQSGLRRVRMLLQSAPYGEFVYREGDQKDSDKGSNRIRFKGNLQRKGSLSVGDDVFWRQFDTSFDPDFPRGPGQNGYKVTDEPSFDAPRADLAIKGGNVKVYLKRLPRVFALSAFRWFYGPYGFWQDHINRSFNQPSLPPMSWVCGGQLDVRHPFEGYKGTTAFRDYALHWQARASAQARLGEQATAEAAMLADVVEDWFQDLLADNGPAGFGYIWFPAAYSWTTEQRESVPRFYEDIPRGFYLFNGNGHIFSSQWSYEGEFLGGVGYQGKTFYVWRYTTGSASSLLPSSGALQSWQMSHPSWAGGIEPAFIFTAEGGIITNAVNELAHLVKDTTRDQSVTLVDLPITGEIQFHFPPKYWTDFSAKPRRFQT